METTGGKNGEDEEGEGGKKRRRRPKLAQEIDLEIQKEKEKLINILAKLVATTASIANRHGRGLKEKNSQKKIPSSLPPPPPSTSTKENNEQPGEKNSVPHMATTPPSSSLSLDFMYSTQIRPSVDAAHPKNYLEFQKRREIFHPPVSTADSHPSSHFVSSCVPPAQVDCGAIPSFSSTFTRQSVIVQPNLLGESMMNEPNFGGDQAEPLEEVTMSIFACKFCKKVLANAKNLGDHERGMHTGVKALQCCWCDERFSTRQRLRSHRKKVHDQQMAGDVAGKKSKNPKNGSQNIVPIPAVTIISPSPSSPSGPSNSGPEIIFESQPKSPVAILGTQPAYLQVMENWLTKNPQPTLNVPQEMATCTCSKCGQKFGAKNLFLGLLDHQCCVQNCSSNSFNGPVTTTQKNFENDDDQIIIDSDRANFAASALTTETELGAQRAAGTIKKYFRHKILKSLSPPSVKPHDSNELTDEPSFICQKIKLKPRLLHHHPKKNKKGRAKTTMKLFRCSPCQKYFSTRAQKMGHDQKVHNNNCGSKFSKKNDKPSTAANPVLTKGDLHTYNTKIGTEMAQKISSGSIIRRFMSRTAIYFCGHCDQISSNSSAALKHLAELHDTENKENGSHGNEAREVVENNNNLSNQFSTVTSSSSNSTSNVQSMDTLAGGRRESLTAGKNVCGYCGKNFQSSAQLKRHMVYHRQSTKIKFTSFQTSRKMPLATQHEVGGGGTMTTTQDRHHASLWKRRVTSRPPQRINGWRRPRKVNNRKSFKKKAAAGLSQVIVDQQGEKIDPKIVGLMMINGTQEYYEEEDPHRRYCICDQTVASSTGVPMVCCENDACPHGQWFHFGCAGLVQAPTEKIWYCPGCRQENDLPSSSGQNQSEMEETTIVQ